MNDYLILFENMLGVVAMRKHLTAAGQPFTVTDIPPSLGKACGLGIRLSVSDDSLRHCATVRRSRKYTAVKRRNMY